MDKWEYKCKFVKQETEDKGPKGLSAVLMLNKISNLIQLNLVMERDKLNNYLANHKYTKRYLLIIDHDFLQSMQHLYSCTED